MDFLEFLKSACYYSAVKFDMRDNMIYKWQTSEYTGFSLHKQSEYYIRVDYCGSATGYSLQPNSSSYDIYKDGSHTNFILRDEGYGELRLYHGGSLYGQGDYMKEKEEEEQEQISSQSFSASKSNSSVDEMFSGGFWSWGSWGKAWLYFILISWVWPLAAPYVIFMVIWAILLIFHRK